MEGDQTIERVMKTAKLSLTDSEKKAYSKDMKNILAAFASLDEVDVCGVKPAFQPIDIKDRTREDVVEDSLIQKDALANTKNKKNGYFVGPKAI